MATFLHIEIDMVAVIMLCIMYLNNRKAYSTKDAFDQRLFRLLIIALSAVLLLDSLMWHVDGKLSHIARGANFLSTYMYYLVSPMVPLLYMLYSRYKIQNDSIKIKKRMPIYFIPIVLNAIIVLLFEKTGKLFSFDASNHFVRGPLSIISPLIITSYLIYACVIAAADIKTCAGKINKGISVYFMWLAFPPIIGGMWQNLTYGVSATWTGFFITLFLIFISLQNNRIYTDNLTGVYSREYFRRQTESMIKAYGKTKIVFLLMTDMNGFKEINDRFGHLEGDGALITVADILKDVCGDKYSIARFGGDEFIVSGCCDKMGEVENLVSDIKHKIAAYNNISDRQYELSCSIGSTVYILGEPIEEMINRADKNMYHEKVISNKGRR